MGLLSVRAQYMDQGQCCLLAGPELSLQSKQKLMYIHDQKSVWSRSSSTYDKGQGDQGM